MIAALPPREEVAGIVLAGGAGSRFGAGRPKAWIETAAGDPLLQVALATLHRVAALLLVAAPEGLSLPSLRPAPGEMADGDSEGFRVVAVRDLAAGEGPLAGLVPALERAQAGGATRAFVLAVDMPRFSAAELALLAAPLERDPKVVAVVPRTPSGLEPLFAYVRPQVVAPAFRAAWEAGERAVHRAFAALPPGALVELDAADPAAWPGGPGRLRSINTPADLRAVLEEPGEGT